MPYKKKGLTLAKGGANDPALAWVTPLRAIKSLLFNIGLVLVGWLILFIHLKFFDRLFLRRGRLWRLMRLSSD